MKLALSFLFLFIALISRSQVAAPITDAEKSALIDSVAVRLDKYYVFADQAKAMGQYLKKKNSQNGYASITDYRAFVDALRADLRSVHQDLHMNISVNPAQVERMKERRTLPAPTPEMLEEGRRQERRDNFGFVKVERLPGNIGYVD